MSIRRANTFYSINSSDGRLHSDDATFALSSPRRSHSKPMMMAISGDSLRTLRRDFVSKSFIYVRKRQIFVIQSQIGCDDVQRRISLVQSRSTRFVCQRQIALRGDGSSEIGSAACSFLTSARLWLQVGQLTKSIRRRGEVNASALRFLNCSTRTNNYAKRADASGVGEKSIYLSFAHSERGDKRAAKHPIYTRSLHRRVRLP